MKKIAIIGANDFQNPLILKAKELGYETHVFAWKDGSIGEKTADYFYPISITKKDEILQKCKEIGIDAVTTIASDLATNTVNYIADKMDLYGNSLECTEISTNKYKMRQAFLKAGVATPKFEIVDSSRDEQITKLMNMTKPLIVKPTDRSGSRSITKIEKIDNNNDIQLLKEAINRAVKDSFENKAIIEEYIEGQEYSAEGITFNGEHRFLTITKKLTTGSPHFIETGHIQPSGLTAEEEQKIYNQLEKALKALKIKNSATHSEFKIDNKGNVKIIEIGARMGGDCIGSDLVKISTGYDYLKMVIDVALGKEPQFKKVCEPSNVCVKFIFNEKDLQEFEEIKKNTPEKIVIYSNIIQNERDKVVDSSTRWGFYIIK